MRRKTISIDQNVYDQLVEQKRDDQSFNDFFRELMDDGPVWVDQVARATADELEERLR